MTVLSPSPAFASALKAALEGDPRRRTAEVCVDGRTMWLKRTEAHPNMFRRLLKGDAGQALAREAEALRSLAARGVPVPAILAEGDGYLVLDDAGPTLEQLLRRNGDGSSETIAAFAAAGRAIGRLHRMGLAHGRAMPHDLCWNGEAITFIDLEAMPRRPGTARAFGRELINFIFRTYYNAIRLERDLSPELRAFCLGYREEGDPAAFPAARTWARRRWWLIPLVAPVAWLTGPRKAPDTKAIAPTLIYAAQFLPS